MMNAHINEICIDIIVSPLQHNSSGVICHKINRYERSANHENISESNTNTSCVYSHGEMSR